MTFAIDFSSLKAGIMTFIYNLFPKGKLGRFVRLATGPFSNLSTPRGHTAEHIPQPTQEERTMFCTLSPISSNAKTRK